jgi:hypothetical protein
VLSKPAVEATYVGNESTAQGLPEAQALWAAQFAHRRDNFFSLRLRWENSVSHKEPFMQRRFVHFAAKRPLAEYWQANRAGRKPDSGKYR